MGNLAGKTGAREAHRGAGRRRRGCIVTEDAETLPERCDKDLFDLGRGLARRRWRYLFEILSERPTGTMHDENRKRVRCILTRGAHQSKNERDRGREE